MGKECATTRVWGGEEVGHLVEAVLSCAGVWQPEPVNFFRGNKNSVSHFAEVHAPGIC